MAFCAKMRNSKKSEVNVAIQEGLEIIFYSTDKSAIHFSQGEVTAEDLCIEAALKCNISPLCHNLFSLYNEKNNLWYPPNYIFKIDANTLPLRLHYRMRYVIYFITLLGVFHLKQQSF
ncbi:hypothetical protein FKM82_022297, partial [Ascaphus truei]